MSDNKSNDSGLLKHADILEFPDDYDNKSEEIKKYFEYDKKFEEANSTKSSLFGVAGILLIVGCIWGIWWCFLVAAALAGFAFMIKVDPVISDKQFFKWRDMYFNRIREKSLEKACIHKKDLIAPPISIISSPAIVTGNKRITDDSLVKELGRFAYNPIILYVLYELEKQVLACTIRYNIINDEIESEGSDEFYYKDIVSVSTGTRKCSTDSTYNVFELVSAGGNKFTVPLSTPDDQGTYQTLITNDVDQMISRIRQNVRKFKD